MISRKRFLLVWLGGLAAFGVAIWLHGPLAIPSVPGGIMEHQTAATAARVDFIQAEWAQAGVYRAALTAMLSDIAFIVLYGLGSLLGGLYFLQRGMRAIGWLLSILAVVFFATDMTETVLEVMQLAVGRGDDTKAAIAAAMQYPKIAGWTACLVLPIVGLLLERRAAPTA
ncbi:hypothetical protein LY632_07410 [Erythrobacter sp. SDW2]|uniref:hypothetical protein n=1 Tax=Erythrobacter sp. SDW2 TaxID=2907154 RepID=UPI001F2BD759|nr:hypothetical protein [Erythrobacter sp. SDW2]UIP05547.1 hypothetical protein LY632_07410 [Erythrobacter sp. SDW2]